jgi:hypothetical protein
MLTDDRVCVVCCCVCVVSHSQVRAGLAQLGLRSLDELVGRADYLKQRDTQLAKTSESHSWRLVVISSVVPSTHIWG